MYMCDNYTNCFEGEDESADLCGEEDIIRLMFQHNVFSAYCGLHLTIKMWISNDKASFNLCQ